MTFDYVEFINDGFESQQKYDDGAGEYGPNQFRAIDSFPASKRSGLEAELLPKRYAKIIDHFGHMIEEAIEARVYIPRRKWKNREHSYLDNTQLREEFVAEMFDILLHHRAILAYAGVTGEEFERVAAEKLAYNRVRKDHSINGDEVVAASPLEELSGNCASSGFANNSYDRN